MYWHRSDFAQHGASGQTGEFVDAAKAAEQLRCDSLWVAGRLLYPVNPRTIFAMTPDGTLPEIYNHVLDPIEALTFIAAHTCRISLGTSVRDLSF